MAGKKKGIVLKLPRECTSGHKLQSLGYGLHLIATGQRATKPIPVQDLKSVRIVLTGRAQTLWDSLLPKFESKAALAREVFAVVKEIGPAALNVQIN